MKSGLGMKLIDLFVFNQHGTVIIYTPTTHIRISFTLPSFELLFVNNKQKKQQLYINIMIIVFA